MAGRVKTYDPKDMIIIFRGAQISGFADGTFLNIVPGGQRYTKAVGADGEVARSKSNDNTHEVTLTLMATSQSNDTLSVALLADKLFNAGAGPLQIIDKNGTTLYFWDIAWVRQPPDIEGSKEISERAWTLDTGQVVQEFVGGSLVTA